MRKVRTDLPITKMAGLIDRRLENDAIITPAQQRMLDRMRVKEIQEKK